MERARTTWREGARAALCLSMLSLLLFALLGGAFTGAAYAQDASREDTLLTKISASYAGAHGAWQAVSLSACGLGDSANKEPLLAETVAAAKNGTSDTTLLQRNVIALTAAGYDCTALPDGSATVDAIAAMALAVDSLALPNAKLATLLAYASGGYSAPDDALLSQEELIASVQLSQLAGGGFTYYGTVADADMTAFAINALLPFAGESERAAETASEAQKALLALQHSDGTWGSGAQKSGNANSTAFAVIALCAMGADPARPLAGTSVAPLDALLSFAAADNSGFLYGGKTNALATEQGFRALVACKGFAAGAKAYNLYTQASEKMAVFTAVALSDSASSLASKSSKSSASKSSSKKKAKASSSKKSSASSDSSAGSSSGVSTSRSSSADDDNEADAIDDGDDVDVDDDVDVQSSEDVGSQELATASLETADAAAAGEGASSATPSSRNTTAWFLIAAGALLLIACAALYLRWRRNGNAGEGA